MKGEEVANLISDAGIIERYGSGIVRSIEAFKKYGLQVPRISEVSGGFEVMLYSKDYQESNGGVNGGVNVILNCVENNSGINVKGLMEELNISQRTLEREVKKLKNLGLIEFRGVPKTGGYYRVESENK